MPCVTFKTDLFFKDIPDEQLGQWFIGGDCAAWFYVRLLPHSEITRFIDPCMEDWGWYFSVKVNGTEVSMSIWEHFEHEDSWVIEIASKKPFFRKLSYETREYCDNLIKELFQEILANDSRFTNIVWSEKHPNH